MVSLPLVALYEIPTEVTSAACLGKNPIAFGSGKLPSGHSIPPFNLALTSRLPKCTQSPSKVGIGLKFIRRAGMFHGTSIQVAEQNALSSVCLPFPGTSVTKSCERYEGNEMSALSRAWVIRQEGDSGAIWVAGRKSGRLLRLRGAEKGTAGSCERQNEPQDVPKSYYGFLRRR
jgi:hypothetical protein